MVKIMKKFVKVIALVLALVTLTTVLASCGGLSGKYEAISFGTGSVMEFKGSKVIITYKALGEDVGTIEGKYSVKGDVITFEFSTDDIENDLFEDFVEKLNDVEHSFEKGDDFIKIGGVKYTKAD